ncbi:nicotinate-nucleotide--dimethylbenzimidazole phosphoribosyltransferase [Streptomyces sp. TRM66268-LWL]|uniref:Nicotinate-nucleotide--dimethylbenzimidazole phosphoribosyltransferase n=1 Tax=Streptomyces polyasparticus TaxID=2767826 RepID=A0ABR7SL53_9ACTN|nr:nicotinate-nucleotide--dimethylbenzimidazole phosphoribosyltransferase [Streptomyces polyasparticus]MBC9715584.1 nicotinate-nucleotide--dimethylbenzimidazole phosphoribosyltransferase [Streptomyces polyasparticus]
MTDTGQVPGEGLPQDAGTVGRPGVPAPGAHTFHDPSGAAAEDDDLLLMPGAQGAWTEDRPAFTPEGYAAAQGYGMGEAGPQGGLPQGGFPQEGFAQGGLPQGDASQSGAPQAGMPQAGTPMGGTPMGGAAMGGDARMPSAQHGQAPLGAHPGSGYAPGEQGGPDAAGGEYPGAYDGGFAGADAEAGPLDTGAHEAAGRDSGSVDLGGARMSAPKEAPVRRPLHMGPPAVAAPATPSPVRSLADRGPAGTPATPVRRPGPPTSGPEYLDIPREADGTPVAPGPQLGSIPAGPGEPSGPQLGEIPAQSATPWPQPSQAQGAETVVPQARPAGATPATPDAEAFRAAQEAAGFQAAPAPQGAALLGVPEPAYAAQGAALSADSAQAYPAHGGDFAQGPAEPTPGEGFAPQGGPQLHLGPQQSAGAAMQAGEHHPPVAPIPMPAASSEDLPAGDGGAIPAGLNPQDPGPIGEFVPVDGVVPSTPHLAPTPPQPLRLPQEPDERTEEQAAAAQESVAEAAAPAQDVAEQAVPLQDAAVSIQNGPVPAEATPVPAQDAAATAPEAGAPAQEPAAPAEPGQPQDEQSAQAEQLADEPVLPADVDAAQQPANQPANQPENQPETEAAEALEAGTEPAPDASLPVPAPREGEPAQPAETPEHLATADAEVPAEQEPAPAADATETPAESAEPQAPAAAQAPADESSPESEPVAAEPLTDELAEEGPELLQFADELATQEGAADDAEVRTDAPAAPGYADAEREAVLRVMRERRDIRNGFRSDPIPHEVLLRVLEAAHTAPSVGHSQPWDFVVIRSAETRRTMHELAMRQREAYAKSLPKGRAKQFKELKIEAILETPVNIVVTADPTRGGRHTLGRHTQPQMAPYSSALAVENLWLAARAEGLGVGWVSFFDEREMVRTLGLPDHLEVVAYLCVGYVDEFPDEPELMQAGWSKRRPLSWVVHEETYGRRALPGEDPHDLLSETVANIRPLDAKALGEAWERQKRMTKPAGALGMLEIISAQLAGLSRMCPPPIPEPAAVAIFAGDHGVHAQGVTPWPQEVTGQMVANFLGGGAVCNAFANQVGAEVCVIDVGVASDLPATPGLLPRKVRAGTADMTTGPALTREEVKAAIEVGIETARDLVAAGNKALLTGEMGIANTTASAALISVFTGADPSEVTGRGTGINDETLARKTDVVRRALELHQPDPADPIGVLAAIGGLEHAAIVGLLLGGASLRTPVILDGVSAGAAALVARAIAPEVLAACIAGHRSAEPGHVAALNKLGLRPLVDLDLRLGEGTGALLALPVVQSAARAMHEVATFDSAGVTEK